MARVGAEGTAVEKKISCLSGTWLPGGKAAGSFMREQERQQRGKERPMTSCEPPCPPANSGSVVAAAFSSSDGLTFPFKGAEVVYFLLFMVPYKLET